VGVDEAGRDDRTAGVDLGFAVGREIGSDFDDAAVTNANVGAHRRRAGSVDDLATPNEEAVVHGGSFKGTTQLKT
jgi:hypothetical protein